MSPRCVNCNAIAFRKRIWNARLERYCETCWNIIKEQVVTQIPFRGRYEKS